MRTLFLIGLASYLTNCGYTQSTDPKGQNNSKSTGGPTPSKETDRLNSPSYEFSAVRSLSTTPKMLMVSELGQEGLFRLDETDRTSTDNSGTVLVTKSGRRYKRIIDNEINVRWFGAKGDGISDDKTAIQRAINYTKTLSAKAGGSYRVTVVFPAGFYYLSSPIDVTNTNGIWLKGSSGRYINTGFIGGTGGAMLDFSGSTMGGCEGFSFISLKGSTNRSTIGALFALTSGGGLNCSLKNCYFKLEDNPAANNGFGTIGILNIRSEEFSVSDCVVNANTPVILSNKSDLSDTNVNLLIKSPYAQITTGVGSMGVVSFSGQVSLQSIEKRQPALVLNGTNTVHFVGYIGRTSQLVGEEGPAILCSQSTSNLTINATVESYSQVLLVKTSMYHSSIDIVSANVVDASVPLINITGASLVDGLTAKIHLPVIKEQTKRYLLYHAPVSNGNEPVRTRLVNSAVYCSDLTDNTYAITKNLLKATDNVEFNTSQPFSKKGGKTNQNFTNRVSCGLVGSIKQGTIIRFGQCDRTTKKSYNGGFYTIEINGIVRAGSYNSGGSCTQRFTATITISQSNNGNQDAPAYTMTLLGKSQVSPSYLDIKNVAVSVNFSNGIGSVVISPTVTGSGVGEAVTYTGTANVMADFYVNDPVLFK